MTDDENTVHTTSKKNRIQSGTGHDGVETRAMLLQVYAPVWMDQETVQKTVQKAIVEKTEEIEGRDDDN